MARPQWTDEKDYWKGRHEKDRGAYRAVGIDTLSERANAVAYRLVTEAYGRLLDRLALPSGTSALDAGAGIGAFSRFLHQRGFEVTALDISEVALSNIECAKAKVCSPIAQASFPEQAFPYVHSFDVLYHVMDDREWEASLRNLCRWSSRHVVLHERFMRTGQLLPSRIMKLRTYRENTRVLASEGFREVDSEPTYFLSKHLLTYVAAAWVPGPFYRLDHGALTRFGHNALVRALSSHHIKVFERR